MGLPKDGTGVKASTINDSPKGSNAVDAQLKGMKDTVLGGTELEQD